MIRCEAWFLIFSLNVTSSYLEFSTRVTFSLINYVHILSKKTEIDMREEVFVYEKLYVAMLRAVSEIII